VAALTAPAERDGAGAASATRPTDVLSRGFVLLMAALTAARAGQVGAWPWLLLADLLILILLDLLGRAPSGSRLAGVTALWYPFLLIGAYYGQLGVIGLGVAHVHDAAVQHWEAALFGGQPSLTWQAASGTALLSTVLHACYLAHYLIIIAVPAWLWWRAGREASARAVFGIALAFDVCYVAFAVFPVAGPWYTLPAPRVPLAHVAMDRAVHALLDAGSSFGTAFPSSHVAASWCAVLMARRHAPWLAAALAPVVVGLALGTVYGQFHYVVDAVAGAAVAVACALAADPLRRRLAPAPR